jgi:hypothetical protein
MVMPKPASPTSSQYETVRPSAAPPGDGGGLAVGVGEVDSEVPGRSDEPVTRGDEALGDRHVPAVIALREESPFSGEDDEGSELEVVGLVDRPAVPAVGVDEAIDGENPLLGAVGEVGDVDASVQRCRQQFAGAGGHGVAGRTHGCVLTAEQLLGLGAPREQLGVERQPVGVEDVPEIRRADGCPGAFDDLGLPCRIGEERSPCAGVDRSSGGVVDLEPACADVGVAAHDGNRPGSHVLLLADHLGDAVAPVGGEGLGRVFEDVGTGGGGRRRHGRREVDQPAGVDGEAAHDLERRGRVLCADGDARLEAGVDDALAEHVGGVKQLSRPFRLCRLGTEGLRRFPVGAGGRNRDQLAFGVAQRGELATEHAAGVDADGVVDPLRFGDRGVAVDDDGGAPVVVGPWVADGEAELVGLAGGVPVEGEAADRGRRPVVQPFGEPGVGNDAAPVVDHRMADQAVDELGHLDAELLGLGIELGDGLSEAVGNLDVAAFERAPQLVLVVARDACRGSVSDHAHGEAEHPGAVGAAVDEVADEERLPARGMAGGRAVSCDLVAELGEQGDELVRAPMDVADEVERSVVVATVGPPSLPLDRGGGDVVGALQDEYPAEALALEALDRLAELLVLTAQRVRGEVSVGAVGVAFGAHLLWDIEHDGDG